MNFNSYKKNQITAVMPKLTFFFILFTFAVFSCKNQETKSHSESTLPFGKWKVLILKKNDQSIVFDTNQNYYMELDVEKRLVVTAEDNTLSANLTFQPRDSLKIKSIEMTDVCCNSDTANALFEFFHKPIKYIQQENNLTLFSEKGMLILSK